MEKCRKTEKATHVKEGVRDKKRERHGRSTERQRGPPTCPLTSSRVSMAEPGVVAAVLRVVLGAVPEELTESISPATSWISRARTARSLARSWLILRTQGNSLLHFRWAPVRGPPHMHRQRHHSAGNTSQLS